jgi:hypothetical protein
VTFRLRAVTAMLAVAIGALVLSACGGGKKSSSTTAGSGGNDATSLISQTFSGQHNVKSGKLALTIALDLKGGGAPSGPINIKLDGPFDGSDSKSFPKLDFNLTVDTGGQAFSAGVATDAKTAVLKFQGQNYAVPASFVSQFTKSYEQAKAKAPKSGGGTSLKDLGIDPAKLIKNPKVVGDEDVAGTPTTHISAPIDIDQLLNAIDTLLSKAGSLGVPQTGSVPTKLTDAQKQEVRDAVKSATIDVWTGKDDKTIRKLQLKTSIAPKSSGSGGLQSANVALTMQLSDVNKAQTITLPTNAKPLSDLTSQLGGLGGALGGLGGSSSGSGSSGSGSSGSGSSGSAATKNLQKYETCIQKAGTDLSKAQKCASLLTG